MPGGRSATLRIFFSSSTRLTFVCRRPAVSASTRSWLRASARWTASKTTELGSPPSVPRTTGTPARSAQSSSCSEAAALNVSPAARMTERPSATCRRATFPIVVVFPTPFTPTNSHTFVAPSSKLSATLPAASSDLRIDPP